MGLEESATYQAVLAEGWPEDWVEGWTKKWAEAWDTGWAKGRIEQGKKTLMRLGRKCFGEPSPEIIAAIEAITDVEHIASLVVRLLDVSSWDELLSGDEPGRPA